MGTTTPVKAFKGIENLNRALSAQEINVRVERITDKTVSLLLYKDARVDMEILDESVGQLGWKREQIPTPLADGSIYMLCRVSLYDDKTKSWISKDDAGRAGYFEKEKSLASDSFKRACTNWGIGRCLYTAPDIIIPRDEKFNISPHPSKDGVFVCYDTLSVSQIVYNEQNEITALAIKNETTGYVVFKWDNRVGNAEKISREKAGKSTMVCPSDSFVENKMTPTLKPKKESKGEKKETKTSDATEEKPTITPAPSEDVPVSESQTAPESDATSENDYGDVVVDVGRAMKGKTVKELAPAEVAWAYEKTKSPEVKKALYTFAQNDETVKNAFIARGYNVK